VEDGDAERAGSAQPDWSRERKTFWSWQPSRSLLASIRAYRRASARGGLIGGIGRRVAVARHRFWSVVTGADIPVNADIEGGLLLPHPNGVVVHPRAIVGANCLLFQQVTLGTRGTGQVPRLGCWVEVGAGAKILGGISIGDHAVIGANAVVLSDVAPHSVVVGIPARPLESRAAAVDAV
jgi:serine O-acetyltransferase